MMPAVLPAMIWESFYSYFEWLLPRAV